MNFYYLFLLKLLIAKFVNGIEPLSTVIIGGGGAALGYFGYNFDITGTLKKQTYCRLFECCNDDYVQSNIEGLKNDLKEHLFGQHILIEQLIPVLEGHLHKNSDPKKPLVISFHGTPGVGKNFVTDLISKNLYRNGLDSKFIRKWVRADFTLENKINFYQEGLNTEISDYVRRCPRSLFIFDEVEKIPQGLFETITAFFDHHHNLNGLDYRKAIFVFLSNTGGLEISRQLGELMQYGSQRDDTKLHDFEPILEGAAYNLKNALTRSTLIESHLIDVYIPFLPLEKKHVRQCIITEYQQRNITPTETSINGILDNYVTYETQFKIFAKTGCKRLGSKVIVDIKKNYENEEKLLE